MPAEPDDVGAADPRLVAALAAYDGTDGTAGEVWAALAVARLLVPVVPVPAGRGERGGEKTTEMAVPTLVGADGRRALPAFTCLPALAAWRADARPTPMPAQRAMAGALDDGCAAVVVDVSGPVTFVVEGADLTALARGFVPAPGTGLAARPVPPADPATEP